MQFICIIVEEEESIAAFKDYTYEESDAEEPQKQVEEEPKVEVIFVGVILMITSTPSPTREQAPNDGRDTSQMTLV